MGQDGAGATLAHQGAAARRSFISDPKSRLGPRSDTQRTAVQSDRGMDEFSAIDNAERGTCTWRTLFAARFMLPGSRRSPTTTTGRDNTPAIALATRKRGNHTNYFWELLRVTVRVNAGAT